MHYLFFQTLNQLNKYDFFFSKSDRMTRAFDIPINKEKQ